MDDFHTPDGAVLVVRAPAGLVSVRAEDGDRTTVAVTPLNTTAEEAMDEVVVEQRGRTVAVRLPRRRGGLFRQSPSFRVEVSCPSGSSLDLKADSADVRVRGTFAEVGALTGSGSIDVDHVSGAARLKTGSGEIAAGHVDGELMMNSGSGDVSVGNAGRSAMVSTGSGAISFGEISGVAVAKTGSGDVEVGRLRGDLTSKSGSGDLVVRRAASGALRANGASGNVSIGVEQGTAAWLDVSTVSGRVSQELGESAGPPEGHRQVEITVHRVSGNLRVHRA